MLRRVWAASGGLCGKYLVAAMEALLTALEAHDELVDGKQGYNPDVRQELLSMSAATIDRYLADARKTGQLRSKAATRPSPLLRTSIKIRKAGDEVEAEPGFFECDTVANCGPSLQGEFVRTVNFTDVHTGWVFTRSIRNSAHVHIRQVMDSAVGEIPYSVVGLDFDNGSEFLNYPMIDWAAEQKIFFTRGQRTRRTTRRRSSRRTTTWYDATGSTTATTPPPSWPC